MDLTKLAYSVPGAMESDKLEPFLSLDKLLQDIEELLPSWSNNISNTYFSHARTFAITIGT